MFGLLKSKIANFIGSVVKKAGEIELGKPAREIQEEEESGGKGPEKKLAGLNEEPKKPPEKLKEEAAKIREEPKKPPKPDGKSAVPEKEKAVHEGLPKHQEKLLHAASKKENAPAQKKEAAVDEMRARKHGAQGQAAQGKEDVFDVSRELLEPAQVNAAKKPGIALRPGKEAAHLLKEKKEIAPFFKEGKDKPIADSRLASLEKAVKKEQKKEVELSIVGRIKSVFSDEVELSEKELSGLFDSFELSLLEADVAYDVALEITASLRKGLAGKKVSKKKIGEEVKKSIGDVLEKAMTTGKEFDLVERIRACGKPARILFIGPNGAGKTTTIAKIIFKLKEAGFSCVIAAGDTFRAAAIEQMQVHADRLGVKLVKSAYGSDPAAVAFDAISFAKAHGIDAVLIDSAGRQETNRNLLDELKKIARIAKPDLKIYVGESFGGNQIIGQIVEFDKAIGIDGVILTKIDCDAKGGSAISVTHATGVPIVYVGTGQGYSDFEKFEPARVAESIIG